MTEFIVERASDYFCFGEVDEALSDDAKEYYKSIGAKLKKFPKDKLAFVLDVDDIVAFANKVGKELIVYRYSYIGLPRLLIYDDYIE